MIANRTGKFYVYAVIDPSTTPPTLIDVELTRQGARTDAGERSETPGLRVRRAKLTLFDT